MVVGFRCTRPGFMTSWPSSTASGLGHHQVIHSIGSTMMATTSLETFVATTAEQNANRRPCRTGPAHGNFSHGMTRTPEHRAWANMKTRCFNPNSDGYLRYGGKGITMCSRWRDSFEEFHHDLGPRPSTDHVLARLDTDGHYSCGQCPDCESKGWAANCVWLTRLTRNQTRKKWEITTKGSDGRFCRLEDQR